MDSKYEIEMGKKQFVVICGIDGSGKTTLINALEKENKNWSFTNWQKFSKVFDKSYEKEDTTNPQFIEGLSPFTRSALFLYLFGLQLDKIIFPGLRRGNTIISDSYWYKFVAKMEVTKHGEEELLRVCVSLLKPDKIILIDTAPEVAFQRKTSFNFYETNGDKSNFINFQTEIRSKILNYISFSKNVLVLNDNQEFKSKVEASLDFIYKS
jgi:thymidylate kinase